MKLPIFKMLDMRFTGEGRVEADGFFQGSHGTNIRDGQSQVDAEYASQAAELEKNQIASQKKIEGRLEHMNAIRPSADLIWATAQDRNPNGPPELVMAVIVALVGCVAILTEAKLLAPSMDVLGIADPNWQLFTAGGLVSIASLSFHFGWKSIDGESSDRLKNWVWRIAAAGCAVALACWGVLRGQQAAFAASINHNPLADFLNSHPTLSSIFYVTITLGAPLVAACATHFSADRIRNWYAYRVSKRQAEGLSKETTQLTKQLEADREVMAKALEQLTARRDADKAKHRQHHARGQCFGANQEPYWTVSLKATMSMLAVAVVLSPLTIFLPPLYAAILLLVWIASFVHFRRNWQNPGPEEFLEIENVQFTKRASDADKAELAPIEIKLPNFGRKTLMPDTIKPKELEK